MPLVTYADASELHDNIDKFGNICSSTLYLKKIQYKVVSA